MKKVIKIEGMTCAHCSARVQKALDELPGMSGVFVNLKKGEAYVNDEGAGDDAIKNAVEDAGYSVISVSPKKGFTLFGKGKDR